MLGVAVFDIVLRNLIGEALEELAPLGVVNQQVHASFLVFKSDALCGGVRASDLEQLLG